MSRTIVLDNVGEQKVTIQKTRFNRVLWQESSVTGSSSFEITRSEALELAMALIEAAKP